jgi:hypothetical protein
VLRRSRRRRVRALERGAEARAVERGGRRDPEDVEHRGHDVADVHPLLPHRTGVADARGPLHDPAGRRMPPFIVVVL